MAYVSNELKAKLAPAIKAVCVKYGIKASIAVNNHSTLCLNIKSGAIDFIKNFYDTIASKPHLSRMAEPTSKYIQVNVYHYQDHFTGNALAFLTEVIECLYGPDYYDHSDIQTDYFNCAHYISVNIGRWDKPYILSNKEH